MQDAPPRPEPFTPQTAPWVPDACGVAEPRRVVKPGRLRPLVRRGTRWRWPLSVAAVLAVGALLIAGITTTSQPVSFSSPLAGGVPRYYMTVFAVGKHLRAEVRDSASGRVTGSVQLPGSLPAGTSWQIAGAADDRHFVIAIPVYGASTLTVFGLSLSRGGHPAVREHRAARWNGNVFRSLALSPDGTVAALAFTNFAQVYGSVTVLNLRNGKAKNWSGARAPGFLPGDLSFLGNTRLAVPWVHYLSSANAVLAGVRLLDVSRPGGSLLASRLVAFRVPRATPNSAIVTAGGRDIVASFCRAGTGRTVTAQVALLSGTDGRLIRVLRSEKTKLSAPMPTQKSGASATQTLAFVTCPVLSVDASGRHVLTEAFTFGRLDDHKFQRLPGGNRSFDAAW